MAFRVRVWAQITINKFSWTQRSGGVLKVCAGSGEVLCDSDHTPLTTAMCTPHVCDNAKLNPLLSGELVQEQWSHSSGITYFLPREKTVTPSAGSWEGRACIRELLSLGPSGSGMRGSGAPEKLAGFATSRRCSPCQLPQALWSTIFSPPFLIFMRSS